MIFVPFAMPSTPMVARLPPLAEVLDLVPDAVCVVDGEGHFLYVSAGFERIVGYAPQEVIGRRAFDFVHPDDREATLRQAERINAGELQRHFRNRYLHKDGHVVDIQWSARFLPDHGVRVAVGHEVTELRQAERALEHLASHDALTGLPNRHRLQHELRLALDRAASTGSGLALLYLDLDGFKAANDRSGHAAGDRVLQDVAKRLLQGVRGSDVVARMGGDEFVVVLPGCPDAQAAREVADALATALRVPFTLPDGSIELDASIGIACYPADGQDADTLLSRADRAMYAVKRQLPRPLSLVAN